MEIVLIMVYLFVSIAMLYEIVKISRKIADFDIKIKELEEVKKEQNTALIKLIYHRSIEVEDYETASKIKKVVPKDFDLHKFYISNKKQ